MGYPTLPTAFDLKNRAKFQPPKGCEEIIRYLNIEFNDVCNNYELCENGFLKLSLHVLDHFNCDLDEFIPYLTMLGYQVIPLVGSYEVVIRW